MVDGDPYLRYYGTFQQITKYTDRPARMVVVDPAQTPLQPFGMKVAILSPDQEGPNCKRSVLLAPMDGRFQVTGDETVAEIGDTRLVDFGPLQQVTIKPTIRGARRTTAITYRHVGDLFFQAASR